MHKDDIYKNKIKDIKKFKFDKQVANVFDNMINRSVPLYSDVQELTALLSKKFYQKDSNIYDLGCSTGTSIKKILSKFDVTPNIIGIDNSKEMIKKSKENITPLDNIQLINQELKDTKIENASFCILNYTLQFIQPEERLEILKKIYEGSLDNSCLIVSEKIKHESSQIDEVMKKLHYSFKKDSGYSDLEIAQKREAIEDYLIPFNISSYINMFEEAGFKKHDILLKSYNFISFAAIK